MFDWAQTFQNQIKVGVFANKLINELSYFERGYVNCHKETTEHMF